MPPKRQTRRAATPTPARRPAARRKPARRKASASDGPVKAWLRRISLGLLGLLLGFSVVYVLLLDRQVRQQFDQHRWQLPARVFAAPMELYPRKALDKQELVQELDALGYQRRTVVKGPGSYSSGREHVDIVTRGFDFPEGHDPSVAVRIRFNSNAIKTVTSLPGGQQSGPVRLEPRAIGGIHPQQGEDRVLVNMKQLPPMLIPTLLTVEDRHFYQHSGINPIAIARAMWANLRAGKAVQGGSTLTQQLVKNYFLSHDRTLIRKAKEAALASILEFRYDKEEILEAYLNEIFLGQEGARAIHGFGLASEFYFGRPLDELELPQIAILVGLARGASYYNPRRHPKRALERRNRVLDQLQVTGVASAEQVAAAKAAPLGVTASPRSRSSGYPAFLELVRRQLRRDYRQEDLESEGLNIFTTLNPQIQARAETALRRRLAELENQRKLPRGKLQGAVLVSSRQGGELEAIVGGREAGFDGFNRALDAQRPIGSLVKPAVYLTALEQPRRWSLASKLDDSPITLTDATGKPWRPKNYDRKSHGMVPLIDSLARSLNVSTVRLAVKVGLKKIVSNLHALGVEEDLPAYPSLALGSVSLSPLTVTQVYQTLAADGFRSPLRTIRAVTTHQGRPVQRYRLKAKKVADPRAVYLTNTALQAVVKTGTARGLKRMLPAGMGAAGKTGTTNKLRDSWFAGFTAERVAVVWVGRDDNTPAGLTGSQGALKVWGDLMSAEHPKPLALAVPDGIVQVRVPGSDGSCRRAVTLPFYASNPPPAKQRCGTASQRPATGNPGPAHGGKQRPAPPPKTDAFPLDWLYEDL